MNIEQIFYYACMLCRQYEGLYLRPYLCPAGVATIGYGATFYEDGRRVSLKDPAITKERAEELLRYHLKVSFLPSVIKLCPTIDTESTAAAILDFAFNLGVGNLKASTLRKRILAKDWVAVPTELKKWNKAGGKVLKGLVRRRESESVLVILGT